LMARNARYRVALRRRREGKTDYQARKALVLSGKLRIVARNSLRNSSVQIVAAKSVGDVVLAAAHSKELKKFGWKAPTGNAPAAYLTGFLCGLKAKAKGATEAILDVGLVAPTKGSKLFAVLSGVVDAGVVVPHDEAKIVKEMVKGEHIAKYGKSLGVGSEVYSARFSRYLAVQFSPEKLPEHVAKVKGEIAASFKAGAKGEAKVEVKAEAEPKAKTAEVKAKVKPVEVKAEPAEVKPKAKAKAAVKAEAKQVEAKAEAKQEVKPKAKVKGKAAAKPAEKKVSKKRVKKA
jgi:large subunit ribosomal protein L18